MISLQNISARGGGLRCALGANTQVCIYDTENQSTEGQPSSLNMLAHQDQWDGVLVDLEFHFLKANPRQTLKQSRDSLQAHKTQWFNQ